MQRDQTLEVVGENLVRTFAATRVDEFALVPLGGGSGRFTLAALERLLTGFLRGLRDADPDRRFRGITICEMDRDRYVAIRDEIYRLSATELFDGVEVLLRECALPAAPAAPARGISELPAAQFVYLLIRQESGDVPGVATAITVGSRPWNGRKTTMRTTFLASAATPRLTPRWRRPPTICDSLMP